MKRLQYGAWSLVWALLAGCASAPPVAPADDLFADARFAPPAEPIDAAAIFAPSEAMKRYLEDAAAYRHLRLKGPQRGLVDALYAKGELKLEYDATVTRNASQAFEARTGNCLSLVIMTAAFAKQLGLPVRYQSVYVPETWRRSGDLYLSSGHVNLSLGSSHEPERLITIDFLPPEDLRTQRTRVIDEDTIVAMYMNNRAAESMIAGDTDAAYWWARAAIEQSPRYLTAYNTLAVVYLRAEMPLMSERALRFVLEREPGNTQAMSNLVPVLQALGRDREAQETKLALARAEPHPPYHFFDRGLSALRVGEYEMARDLFTKEVRRAAYHAEFHFGLALANAYLGDFKAARRHLGLAVEHSTTSRDRELYAAKLEALRAPQQ